MAVNSLDKSDVWGSQKIGKRTAMIVATLALPFQLALEGWALSCMWRWFVQPLGAPVLPFGLAIGLMVLASYLKPTPKIDVDAMSIKDFSNFLSTDFVRPLIYLTEAFVVHLVLG